MTEHAEQSLVFAWAKINEARHPELALLHAVQNWAGVKGRVEGARRKREGVRAGVPDTHLPVARGGWHSLYIEMKRIRYEATKTLGYRPRRTQTSAEQRTWMEALTEEGNLCVVCWRAEEAQAVLEQYLTGQLPRSAAG